jgi:Fur family transcriptional regulator, ferric uptake regulator
MGKSAGSTMRAVATREVDKSKDADSHGEELVFERFLKSRGLKYTPARKQLLRAIFSIHDHFTAEQLLDRLKSQGIAASKATVYRTLAVMLACDLLELHDFGEGSRYYEHTFGHAHHDHLFCVNCKTIKEFSNEAIESLQQQVARRLGFELMAHTLKMYGLCSRCRNDPAARPKDPAPSIHRG